MKRVMTYINPQEGDALRQLVAHDGICMRMVGLAWLFENVIHDHQRLSTTLVREAWFRHVHPLHYLHRVCPPRKPCTLLPLAGLVV